MRGRCNVYLSFVYPPMPPFWGPCPGEEGYSKYFLFFPLGGDFMSQPLNIKISKKIFNDAYLSELENYNTRFNVFYGGA